MIMVIIMIKVIIVIMLLSDCDYYPERGHDHGH